MVTQALASALIVALCLAGAASAQDGGPDDAATEWARVLALARRGDADALDRIRVFRERWTERPAKVDFELGRLLYELGYDGEALEAFHDALESDPFLVQARIYRALVLARTGRHQEAERDLLIASRLSPAQRDGIVAFQGDLKRLQAQTGDSEAPEVDERLADLDEAVEDLGEELDAVRDLADAAREGSTTRLLTGNASVDYTDRDDVDSSFSVTLRPHLHWRFSDRLLFESHLDVALNGDETEVELELANISYILNDYATLQAGLFLTPFGYYQERIHTVWLNRLPDEPLALADDGLVPTNSLGVQLRGVAPTAWARFNYAFYVSNGPRLNLGTADPLDAGRLEFDNYDDLNHNKAIGGRIGFLPIPSLELGYSMMSARVGPEGTPYSDVDARIRGVDLTHLVTIPWLRGKFRTHGEWVWSDVDDADYGAGLYENKREGGYLQLAYRPSLLDVRPIRDLETVVRYDWLRMPTGGPLNDVERWTVGLNYWLGPSVGLKAAYQWTVEDLGLGGEDRRRSLLLQGFIGF